MLDKAQGVSSFQAASSLRKIYNEKKTGHTGTLDPMATGVLPVALGKATRFIDFLPDADKAYVARLRFGITTDTLDITGKVLTQNETSVSASQVEAALGAFRGDILQVPPMYSAISVHGQRLYQLARKGVEIEREARPIRIDALELTDVIGDEFEITVRCSKGTYIRSLIADLGEAMGCGAVMTALRRTAANGFLIENAVSLEALREDPMAALLPLEHPFLSLPQITVTEKQAVRFLNGGALSAERVKDLASPGRYRVYGPGGAFLGLGEYRPEEEPALYVLRVTGNV